MNQYTPNFDDPRVVKRCKRALGFAYGMLSATKPKECHSRTMDRFFGQSQHQLSQYLKRELLIMEDPHYMFGESVSQCKTYRLDKPGADRLYSDIHHKQHITIKRKLNCVAEAFEQPYRDELTTGAFEYKDKSNRYWHPLQNVNSESRKHLFNRYGYSHIYDIKACAPTLIAHLASAYAPKQTITVKRMNNTFDNFLNNTAQFRNHVANCAGIEYNTAKKLINSLFAGANLGCNRDFDTFKMLNYDINSMIQLQQDAQLCELRSAITKAWSLIRTGEGMSVPIGKRITARHKWAVYFQYERLIMTVISDYMDREYISYFNEHDGWSCNVELNLSELLNLVRTKTGIHNLEIEYNRYVELDD